jgi:membrane protein required for colicin V production
MNALDIAITVILGYFLLRGVFRGLVKELVGILGLFIAFWVASAYWPLGAEQLTPITEKESYRGVLSFVIIYLVVYFLVGLISIFVDKIVKIAISPLVSSIFGGILGLLKGLILSLILLTLVTAFLFTSDSFFKESKVWSIFGGVSEEIKSFFPYQLKDHLGNRQKEARGSLSPNGDQGSQNRSLPNLGLNFPNDYAGLMDVKNKYENYIGSDWMSILNNLKPETLTPEVLGRFIREHPSLFNPPSNPNTEGQSSQGSFEPPKALWPEPDVAEE